MRSATIPTSDSCLYCRLAKRLLAGQGMAYREVNLAMDARGRGALSERSGKLSLPRIVVDDEPIGGYDEPRRLVPSGELDAAASLEQAA